MINNDFKKRKKIISRPQIYNRMKAHGPLMLKNEIRRELCWGFIENSVIMSGILGTGVGTSGINIDTFCN